MNTTTMTWPGSSVVQPGIERPTAMRLAETESQRITDAVDALQPEDWTRPTDCTEWNVRQLVSHIAAQAKLFSTPLEMVRQVRAAKARQQPGQLLIDALTAFQIEGRQRLGPQELRAELHRVSPRGLGDAAGFQASCAADRGQGKSWSTAYRRHGPSATPPM